MTQSATESTWEMQKSQMMELMSKYHVMFYPMLKRPDGKFEMFVLWNGNDHRAIGSTWSEAAQAAIDVAIGWLYEPQRRAA